MYIYFLSVLIVLCNSLIVPSEKKSDVNMADKALLQLSLALHQRNNKKVAEKVGDCSCNSWQCSLVKGGTIYTDKLTVEDLEKYNELAGENGKTALDIARENAKKIRAFLFFNNNKRIQLKRTQPTKLFDIMNGDPFIWLATNRIKDQTMMAFLHENGKINYYQESTEEFLSGNSRCFKNDSCTRYSVIAGILATAMYLAA